MDYEYTSPSAAQTPNKSLVCSYASVIALGTLSAIGVYMLTEPEENQQEAAFKQKDATLVSYETNSEGKVIGHFDLDGNPKTIEKQAVLVLSDQKSVDVCSPEQTAESVTIAQSLVDKTRPVHRWQDTGFNLRLSQEKAHTKGD